MIVDKLKNINLYLNMNKGFEKVFEFIEKFLELNLPDGQYELDGKNVYAMVQSYDTVPEYEKQWEAHKKYIDIQYVVSGTESIYWSNIDKLHQSTIYDMEKDIYFLNGEEGTQVKVEQGCFVILMPEDAHKPGCLYKTAGGVKKIVVKVSVQ